MLEFAEPPPRDRELRETLSENFLAFAVATIRDRALPDVRDGLKPVQRRLLYAMHQLRLRPGTPFKKCARIVGDVIGKFHPHGDQAAYDALVRLAQDFTTRLPLVQGQGNFGNIDGDNPAAMRYTEARLTEASMRLLEGLDEDAVDFRPTFTAEDQEPVVLPATYPNLLVNGAIGIAVGMATSIPPHNLAELLDVLLKLVKTKRNPEFEESLLDTLPGPDFPTGGILVEPRESILQAYKTGSGGFRLRARWKREDTSRGQYRIVVTEIPYQVQKTRLIERIAELVSERKVPLLEDVRDESDERVRIVLEPRSRQVDPATLMEALFKNSDLEVRIPLNLNVLVDGVEPKVLSLYEALREFLKHCRDVLQRRSRFRLDRIDHRIEVLDGYMVAFLNLDEVIAILRRSDNAKKELMETFPLSEVQTDAILEMRLRNLRKLEEIALREERDRLAEESGELEKLLGSERRQWTKVERDIRTLRDSLKGDSIHRRRTSVGEVPEIEDVPIEAMVEREPVTVVCSSQGWIRALRGHRAEDEEIRYKEGDSPHIRIHAFTTDRLVLLSETGRAYTMACDRLPGGRGMGQPLRLMIDLANDDGVAALFAYSEGKRRLLASSDGRGLVVAEDSMLAAPGRRSGKQVMTPKNSGIVACTPVEGDLVACVSKKKRLLVFPLSDVPEQERGRGVILQQVKDSELVDARTVDSAVGLSWRTDGGVNRSEPDLDYWMGKRAQAGRTLPRGFPKSLRFS